MGDRRRLAYLIGTVAIAWFFSGAITIYLLYDAAFDAQRARLVDAVKGQARLIEAVARHDRATAPPGRGEINTLSQVMEAHERSPGFGKTGEFVLARHRDDQIVFLISRRNRDDGDTKPVPLAGRLGKPIRLALTGQSGSVIGLDYRGETVLAAYEPVAVLDMGAVAKIDTAEIRAPFVSAAALGGLGELLAILAAALMFVRHSRPLIRRAQQSEADHRMIVETAADGIITFDHQGAIISVNPAATSIFGYPAKQIHGANIGDLIPSLSAIGHSDTATPVEPSHGKAGELTAPPVRQASGLRAGRVTFPIEVSIRRVQLASRVLHTAIVRDVTERQRLEREVIQAQKLEAAGQLATGIAHDFRNLLMGFIGCAEVALSRLERGSFVWQAVEQIKTSALRGNTLVSQLLALSRREGGKPRRVDLNAFVVETQRLLDPLLGEDIGLQVTTSPLNGCVHVDPGHVEQMLMNLALNARDAMPEGGTLTITTAPTEIDLTTAQQHAGLAPGSYAALTVADSGCGMDEETRQHAFEPFFTTKESGHGTGLGLSTVYGILQEYGGHIDLESTPGRGTTITVFLPLVAGAPDQRPLDREQPTSPAAGTETVLVVEDDPAVRMAVQHYLSENGYLAMVASSGTEALRFCRRQGASIDLLLTDVVLPGPSGPTIAEEVKRMRPGTKVVYMSAHSAKGLATHKQLDLDGPLLQKPFTPRALHETLRAALDGVAVAETGSPAASYSYAAREGPPSAAHPTLSAASTEGTTVLVVEDDDAHRLSLRAFLADAGYHPLVARDGHDATRQAREHEGPIGLLLLDLGVPGPSGSALAAALQAVHPEAVVLYISGLSASEAVAQGRLNDAAAPFVQKPIELDDLLTKINEVLVEASIAS